MNIGHRIRMARANKMMTLEELSQKVGVSRQTLSRYENGIIQNIPSDKIVAIAEATGVAPAYVMGWADEMIPPKDPLPLPSFQAVQAPEWMYPLFKSVNDLTEYERKLLMAMLSEPFFFSFYEEAQYLNADNRELILDIAKLLNKKQ